jgi:ABC-2 type transport system permease protein
MSRTIRAIIGAILVLVIAFAAISVCQSISKAWKVDITDQKIYTLSKGTKSILAKLNQPIKAKLYYAKTATLKAPDQIRYFNNYYQFVKALLEEYVAASGGLVKLEIIDPRPFSDDEVEAMRCGLRRFPITEEENFFFGLVVQTQFGVEKVIPFFSPDRQNFVEYDISYLIDTAITRQKRTVGIMSSLPVMGDDMSGYMAQMMRMQGQQPRPPWTFVEQLRRQYEVRQVPADVNEIRDIDILLVIHPKRLPAQTLFAIDQFVLKGGGTIVCVDPYCFADKPDRMSIQMGIPPAHNSDLNVLLRTWGLEMPENTFAGDKQIALPGSVSADGRKELIIGYLGLARGCFSTDTPVTAELNRVSIGFAGVLKEVEGSGQEKEEGTQIKRTPLIMTTSKGNTFSISSQYELMLLQPSMLMSKFIEGDKPVAMGYLVTGRFRSSFPDGVEIEVKSDENKSSNETKDPNEDKKSKKRLTGLKEATEDCAVIVFADVDFISDDMAYYEPFSGFGKVIVGDNSALLLNAIEKLTGSGDLISVRSRGNYRRPFVVVDEIERQAEEATAEEVDKINMQIAIFQSQLQSIVASAKEGQQEVIGSSILQKKKEVELKIHQAQRQLREVKMKRRERIERLGRKLQYANTSVAPAAILVIAVVLGIHRTVRKRHYISHASDA